MAHGYSTEQLLDLVSSEGIGYAVTDGVHADNVEDPDIAVLWRNARHAIKALEQKLDREAEARGRELYD